jgi:hypothetical protein
MKFVLFYRPDLFATSMSFIFRVTRPSVALALRAGCAVRFCNPANAVASLHPGYALGDHA